jgi:hypothetical protein
LDVATTKLRPFCWFSLDTDLVPRLILHCCEF